jgi:hypothetical protein
LPLFETWPRISADFEALSRQLVSKWFMEPAKMRAVGSSVAHNQYYGWLFLALPASISAGETENMAIVFCRIELRTINLPTGFQGERESRSAYFYVSMYLFLFPRTFADPQNSDGWLYECTIPKSVFDELAGGRSSPMSFNCADGSLGVSRREMEREVQKTTWGSVFHRLEQTNQSQWHDMFT